jgi:hypothetical protein
MRVSRLLSAAPLLAASLAASLAVGCSDPSVPSAPESPGAPAVTLAPARPSFGLVGADRTYRDGFNFLFDATGAPLAGGWPDHPPTPWRPTDFDVAIHSRDAATWYTPQPFRGMHGTNCAPYQNGEPANDVRPGDTGSHAVTTYDDMNYRCRNHMMTALKSTGYGAIYLTPNAMVDFSGGEAVVKFALSTLRTSWRDWVDLWITPWDDNLALPLDGSLAVGTDLQGPPRTAIHIRMVSEPNRSRFEAYVVNNFNEGRLAVVSTAGYESILKPVSTRRDTFELRISTSRLRFGMKKLASPDGPAGSITWVDAPVRIPWTRGVLQFGHHSMSQSLADNGGVGGTWHWDDFTIAPAVPFTIITRKLVGGTRVRHVNAATAATPVEFEHAAPAAAFLRFAAFGTGIQVSFDGGATWSDARRQPALFDRPERFRSYWSPVPAGISSVRFRQSGASPANWLVRDVTIWSQNP